MKINLILTIVLFLNTIHLCKAEKQDSTLIWISQANDLHKKGQYIDALKTYDKILKSNSNNGLNGLAWYGKYITLDKLEKYDEALKCCYKLTKLEPQKGTGWYITGLTLVKLNRYDEAFKAYAKTIELSADYAEAWYGKATVFAFQKDKKGVIENLQKAINLKSSLKIDAKKDEKFKDMWSDADFLRLVE